MPNTVDLHLIEALMIDIDGTLWRGNTPLPGLARFFDALHRRGLAYVVATNNTVETPAWFREKFARFGVTIGPDNILTAAVATGAWLRQKFPPGSAAYVIGETGLRQAVQQAGFTLLDDVAQPAAVVVVGGDFDLTYNKLKHAVLHIQRGAAFIGTNPDLLTPTEEGLIPEAGTILAAVQAATGVAPVIIGKPESILFEMALQTMDSRPDRTAMLGDRLETDILGGQRAGLQTILVTTGVDNRDTVLQKQIEPDLIVDGLDELARLLEKG